MKPLIIWIIDEQKDYIKIKKTDFEKYLQQAYDAGVADGAKQIIYSPATTPTIPNAPVWRDGIVYCDAQQEVNKQ